MFLFSINEGTLLSVMA